jgi:hypothetical protein
MTAPKPTEKPMTEAEKCQAEIEALEMERHAYTMLAAAKEKRLAVLGKVYKKKLIVDKKGNTR